MVDLRDSSSPAPSIPSKNRRFKSMGVLRLIIVEIFTYSTVRSATIYNVKVGLVYRIVQILLLTYIVGYEFIHNKAYQTHDTVSSVITSKVKGQGFVPLNVTLQRGYGASGVDFYKKLFTLDSNIKYKILDTAGLIFL
jgi:hypothetical protein